MTPRSSSFSDPAAVQGIHLLITCMDYRFQDKVTQLMGDRGLTGQYDQITIPGAALGVLYPRNTDWMGVTLEQITLAIKLHAIESIIIIDHRDCGMGKAIFGEKLAHDRELETKIHRETMDCLKTAIHLRHPHVKIELLLIDTDGIAETIAPPAYF